MAEGIEQLVARICAMSQGQIIEQLLNFHADFPMDFTRGYLDGLTLERLQHLLLAAHLHRAGKVGAETTRSP